MIKVSLLKGREDWAREEFAWSSSRRSTTLSEPLPAVDRGKIRQR